MILLDSTLKSLEVKLAGAITTSQLPFTCSYVDVTIATGVVSVAGSTDGTTNGGTAVTIAANPASGDRRKIEFISVYNADTVAATVTIQLNNNSTTRIIHKCTLQAGETLQYGA